MTASTRHRARAREHADPHEQRRPIPTWLLSLISVLLVWAISYIASTQRNDAPELGDQRSLATLEGSSSGSASIDGGQLYASNCSACHQATGLGLPAVFPPLAQSEWILGSEKLPVNIVLHGVTGTLTVQGKTYTGQMPSFKDKLNDAEIAAVLSYVRKSFGNGAGSIPAALVQAERDGSAARTQAWNGDEDLKRLQQ